MGYYRSNSGFTDWIHPTYCLRIVCLRDFCFGLALGVSVAVCRPITGFHHSLRFNYFLFLVKKMKNLLLLATCLLSFAAFADDQEQAACQASTDGQQVAQQGCCSWHGGVCGCQGGRVVCCDGRYSPSCGCNKEEQSTQESSGEA